MRPVARLDPEWSRLAAEATARGREASILRRVFFPRMAESAHAVSWFCRTSDDIVDENPDLDSARLELAAWREGLKAALGGSATAPVILRHFAQAVIGMRFLASMRSNCWKACGWIWKERDTGISTSCGSFVIAWRVRWVDDVPRDWL